MVLAVASVVAFTIYQVLATVPQVVLQVAIPTSAKAASEETYTGLVSWITKDSIHIADTYGKTQDFSVDASTKVQKENGLIMAFSDAEIHMYDRVRVEASAIGGSQVAAFITVQ